MWGPIEAQIHKTYNISSYNALSTAEVIQFNATKRTGKGMQTDHCACLGGHDT